MAVKEDALQTLVLMAVGVMIEATGSTSVFAHRRMVDLIVILQKMKNKVMNKKKVVLN